MENGNSIRVNPMTMILILVQMIFTILMIVSFANVLGGNDVAELGVSAGGSFETIEGLPENGKKDIEYYIYKAVASSGTNNNINRGGVTIREGSLINKYFEEIDVHYVNFIADLPDVGQSYQVYYEWSDDAMNVNISPNDSVGVICLKAEQLIYGEFNCVDTYSNMRNLIIGRLLQQIGFDEFSVIVNGSFKTGELDFTIKYLTCDSQCECLAVTDDKKRVAIQGFEDFVMGLGFRPQDIEYRFDNCE